MVDVRAMLRGVKGVGHAIRWLLSGAPFKRNPYADLPSWAYQEPVVSPHIGHGDLVLDIGSGNHPVPRADILADFFPSDDFHRSGRIVEDRPLVVCSVERLPFRAKSIDFAICSHVFEHIANPAVAGKELARVARSGYIETPSYGKDILVGTGYMHKWQVVEFEGTMHFFEYSQRQSEGHVTSPMMDLWARRRFHPWQTFFWERQDLFNTMHIWHGRPSIVEHRRPSSTSLDAATSDSWVAVPAGSLPDVPTHLTQSEINVLERCLATPDGGRAMLFRGDRFESEDGSVAYPVRGKRIYCELPGGLAP